MGDWEEAGRPTLSRSWVEKVNCLHRAWGVVGGDEAGVANWGSQDPPQSPAFSSKVSPLVAFSAVLEAFFFFFFSEFWTCRTLESALSSASLDLHLGLVKVRLRRTTGYPWGH